MKRWSRAEADGSIFVRISYERMIASPTDVFARLISMFEPTVPVDVERLNTILSEIEGRSVEKGKETVRKNAGVASLRDVQEFRYFNRNFFAELDKYTREVFETIEAMPMVAPAPETKSPATARKSRSNKIVIDASGYLRLKGEIPTGIPRVQDFLVRQATLDRDPDVEVVYFNIPEKRFRPLEKGAIVDFKKGTSQKQSDSVRKSIWEDAKVQVVTNPLLGKEFDRGVANRMIKAINNNNQPSSIILKTGKSRFLYQYYKNTIRIRRYANRLLFKTGKSPLPSSEETHNIDGCFLVSHLALSPHFSQYYVKTAELKAFIFHDSIPLEYPQYLQASAAADRIRPKLEMLRTEGAIALCSSEHAKTGLERFDQRIGTVGKPMEFFKMPSSLYIQAARDGKNRPDLWCGSFRPLLLYGRGAKKPHTACENMEKGPGDRPFAAAVIVCRANGGGALMTCRHT